MLRAPRFRVGATRASTRTSRSSAFRTFSLSPPRCRTTWPMRVTRAMFDNVADLQAVHLAANGDHGRVHHVGHGRSRCIPARSATTEEIGAAVPDPPAANERGLLDRMVRRGAVGPPPSLFGFNAAAAGDLVATPEDGTRDRTPARSRGAGWCVLWNHSVEGFPVTDCYENRDGQMVLVRSRQPDFAAGLGHYPGPRAAGLGRGGRLLDPRHRRTRARQRLYPAPGEGNRWITGSGSVTPWYPCRRPLFARNAFASN